MPSDKRKRSSRSDIWDYYEHISKKLNGSTERKCKYCLKVVAGPSSSNFITHLSSEHPKEFQDFIVQKKLLPLNQSAPMSRIDAHFSTPMVKSQALLTQTAVLSSSRALPISLFESDEFRQFLRAFCADCRPLESKLTCLNFKNVRRSIIEEGGLALRKSLNLMKQSFVSLLIDGGTIQRFGSKSTNIIAQFEDKSLFLWSDQNALEDNSEYLAELLSEKLNFLYNEGVAVSCIVSDNASNMQKMGRLLYRDETLQSQNQPVILHIRCAAHLIQLMIKDILEIEIISDCFEGALKIIRAFGDNRGGKAARIQLRKLQQNNGHCPTIYKIISYNETRWWSKAAAIERLIKLKSFISQLAFNESLSETVRNLLKPAKDEQFWSALKELLRLCYWFKHATNFVEGNESSILEVNHAFEALKLQLLKWKPKYLGYLTPAHRVTFAEDAIAAIISVINGHFKPADDDDQGEHYAADCAQFLSSSNFTLSVAANNWLCTWGAAFILRYPSKFYNDEQYKEILDYEGLKSRIFDQILDFNCSTGAFTAKLVEIERAPLRRPKKELQFTSDSDLEDDSESESDVEIKDAEETEVNWLKFWKYMKIGQQCCELAGLAICLLSIAASEAPVERSFSAEKLIWNERRNRMNDDLVECSLRLNYNKKQILAKRYSLEADHELSSSDNENSNQSKSA
jgi:hypothetical protein